MQIGDTVRYTFPSPLKTGKKFVTGVIEFIGESLITVKCHDNSRLKVSFKNFNKIKRIKL